MMSTFKALHWLAFGAVWLLALSPRAACSQEHYYSRPDFGRVEKVDAHMHVYGPAKLLMTQAARDHFHILTIDVDSPEHGQVSWQIRDSASLRQRYPGRVAFAGTFSAAGFTKPGWSRAAVTRSRTHWHRVRQE